MKGQKSTRFNIIQNWKNFLFKKILQSRPKTNTFQAWKTWHIFMTLKIRILTTHLRSSYQNLSLTANKNSQQCYQRYHVFTKENSEPVIKPLQVYLPRESVIRYEHCPSAPQFSRSSQPQEHQEIEVEKHFHKPGVEIAKLEKICSFHLIDRM